MIDLWILIGLVDLSGLDCDFPALPAATWLTS